MPDPAGKFEISALGLALSAEGLVALALAIPVSFLIIAVAYRIVKR